MQIKMINKKELPQPLLEIQERLECLQLGMV